MKCCIACKYFRFDPGSPGYSTLTPGWNASMDCDKDKFDSGNYDFDLPNVALNMAPSCQFYELSEAAIPAGWKNEG